jgi:hypothetical protein
LFDENFGGPIVSTIAQILKFHPDPPEIGSVVEQFGSGAKDQEWIPLVAKDGWVVLSNDRAKRCGGAKLPIVCAEHGVTHILLSKSMHGMKQFYKAAAVLHMWDAITEVHTASPGSRFFIRLHLGKPAIFPWETKPRNVTEMKLQNKKMPATPEEMTGTDSAV